MCTPNRVSVQALSARQTPASLAEDWPPSRCTARRFQRRRERVQHAIQTARAIATVGRYGGVGIITTVPPETHRIIDLLGGTWCLTGIETVWHSLELGLDLLLPNCLRAGSATSRPSLDHGEGAGRGRRIIEPLFLGAGYARGGAVCGIGATG